MRWIRKAPQPRQLTRWRSRFRRTTDFNYDQLRRFPDVINAVEQSLLKEQGWLCAYTGRRIDNERSHIEHVKAQHYCGLGEDVDYRNMVACYPGVNLGCTYGARAKADWPAPDQRQMFVSPLTEGCDSRFHYSYSGKISEASSDDDAARETIARLNLNEGELKEMRRGAIRGKLQPRGNWLSVKQAQRVLDRLEAQSSGALDQFHFVLVHALRNHINNSTGSR